MARADARTLFDELDPQAPPVARWAVEPDGDPVCVLLGAFDPPTIAHLELVAAAMQRTQGGGALCVTKVVLDRPGEELLPVTERVRLVEQLARLEGLGLLLANRGTYLEVARAVERDVIFVIGSDKLEQLADPVHYASGVEGVRETFDEVSFLVAERPGWPLQRRDLDRLDGVFADPILAGMSASEVRRRVREGRSIDGLVPAVVKEAIGGYTSADRDG